MPEKDVAGVAMAMPAGGPPDAESPDAEPISPFRFSVLRDFGRTYLKSHLILVLLYIVGHLLVHTILPQQAAVYLGKLTNHFSSAGLPKAA